MSVSDAKKYLKWLHKKESECRGDLTRLDDLKIYARCRAEFLKNWRAQNDR